MPTQHIAIFFREPGGQRGGALLIMLILLVVGFAVVLVNSLTASSIKTARQTKTAAALAQAKEALIGYAVTYGDTHSNTVPGYLPCPDQAGGANEGSAAGSCGSANISQIGRLPWKTLGLTTLRDGDGECLWYAVSGTYKNSPKTGLMNWDTGGQFQAYSSDGTQLASQVVAVIFAPGAPLGGLSQNRSPDGTAPVCGGNYTAANYLDTGTVNTINFNNADIASGNFIQEEGGGSINDQMVFITRQDIWNAIQKRTDFQPTNPNNPLILMTKQVTLCLADYGHNNGGFWGPFDKSLPWPAPLALSDYSVNANYQDSSTALYAGRVPYSVSNSKALSNNAFSTLMTTANCPSGWAGVDVWWNNWKDHLFYALGQTYKPSANLYQSCGTCVQTNASANNYAAVVMFAGSRLSALNQTRAVKSDITQYLEGNNASNFTGANGNEIYITGSASSTFNDVLYCISQSLNVGPC